MVPLQNKIELPKLLRTNEKDWRGYPIPWIVMRDRSGRAHFTINDAKRVGDAVRKRLCALCGKRLNEGYWFIGGQRCFTHPQGAFVDPPAHRDCAEYAIRVCPYLAAPSYAKRIDARTVAPGATPADMTIIKDTSMVDDRPGLFGLGHTQGYHVIPTSPGQFVMRVEVWEAVSYWRHGQPVSDQEA